MIHNFVWLKCRKREFSHRLHCIILAKIPEAQTTNIDWLEMVATYFSSSVVEAFWNQSLCVRFFPFATICTGDKIRKFNKTKGNFRLFLNQSNVNKTYMHTRFRILSHLHQFIFLFCTVKYNMCCFTTLHAYVRLTFVWVWVYEIFNLHESPVEKFRFTLSMFIWYITESEQAARSIIGNHKLNFILWLMCITLENDGNCCSFYIAFYFSLAEQRVK